MASLENPSRKEDFVEEAQVGLITEKGAFIVDDDDKGIDVVVGDDDGNESDEETVLFDSVCAICDNGGELLCCEGRCIRSFHPTVESGEESACKSLGFSKIQVEAIQNFLCLNCQHKIHQCFVCGKLGSSDKTSSAEVFQCVSATCAYFYHPECVAKLLHTNNEGEAEELEHRIRGGEQFTCPAHVCYVCRQREQTNVLELQFAVCRRCPIVYHRKCLPRAITFDGLEEGGGIIRAWDGLLPHDRVLIYCLKHKIDETLGTPIRNHIRFVDSQKEEKRLRLELLSKKRKVVGETEVLRSQKVESEVPKYVLSNGVKHSVSTMKREISFSEKPKRPDVFRKPPRDSMKFDKSCAVVKNNESRREERFSWSKLLNSKDKHVSSSKYERTEKTHIPRCEPDTYQVDAETKKRLKAMMAENASLVKVEDIVKLHKVPSLYGNPLKCVVDKNITIGKVEGFVEAVRTALQKLDKGGNIEDAKAVCGPEIVNQIVRWKNKLNVYLSPFLHGMRYTSFGRHFTKVEKLQEIVDKLHWYTQTGDMIVDFCCGANDFSWLMKQKLEETGKRCSFKNYDIIQPKNDFCFEKRDWMTVSPEELPEGSNLIMGINPPFGVKAGLANKFIDKALKFQPKILILIVPPETERLDRKRPAYDLIWEDSGQLSGKSFYLPGSVDDHDNQIEQWNHTPPPLYLWSHSDWTATHMVIALEKGHITKEKNGSFDNNNYYTDSLHHFNQLPAQDAVAFSKGGPESSYGVVNSSAGWDTVNGQNLEGVMSVSSQILPMGGNVTLNNMASQYPSGGSLPSLHSNMSAYTPRNPHPSWQPPPPASLSSSYPYTPSYAPRVPNPFQKPPSFYPNTSAYAPGVPNPSQQPSIYPNTLAYAPGVPNPSQQPPNLDPNTSAYAPGISHSSQQPRESFPSLCPDPSVYAPGIPHPAQQPPELFPSNRPNISVYAPGIPHYTQQLPGSVPDTCHTSSAYPPGFPHPSQQPPGSVPDTCHTSSTYPPGFPHSSQQPPGSVPDACHTSSAYPPGFPHPSQQPPEPLPSTCPDMSPFGAVPPTPFIPDFI